jgi:hypothetical protein
MDTISPPLCQRCKSKSRSFLCDRCILGIELGSLQNDRKIGYLFSEGADFILVDKSKYRDILLQFVIIQINRFKWEYRKIVVEPEFIFLKRELEKYICLDAYKTLYIVHDFVNPVLLEPLSKAHFILII